MSMPSGDFHTAIAALEHDLRRWRRASVIGLLGMGILVIAAVAFARRAAGLHDVIEAKRFVLVDAQGRPRADLHVEDKGAVSLSLYEIEGARRVRLALDADGLPRLTLAGRTETRLWLAVNSQGVPEVLLHDQQGTKRIQMTLDQTGAPAMFLSDQREVPRVVFVVDDESGSAVLLHGRGGARASLSMRADGSPLLGLLDSEGNVRFRVP